MLTEIAPRPSTPNLENPYLPHLARITRIHRMVPDNYLFQMRLVDEGLVERWTHRPGQFVELSVIGTGEAPISISSSPTRRGILEFCIRRAGRTTNALYRLPCDEGCARQRGGPHQDPDAAGEPCPAGRDHDGDHGDRGRLRSPRQGIRGVSDG